MNLNAKIIVAINNFFRKYSKIIIIGIIGWVVILIINYYLKNMPKTTSMKNTYDIDKAVMGTTSVPSTYQEKIKETIETYFQYCNTKNYQSAFDMLTDDCKEYLYLNNLEQFKSYIDSIFTSNKIYNIQNYSNAKSTYIYDINIIDDIGATGTSGNYEPYKEKLSIFKDGDTFKISNNGYIENDELNLSNENEYMKMKILSKDVSYKKEAYNVEIKNNTDSYLIIADNTVASEITLAVTNSSSRVATNISNAEVTLKPGETEKFTFIFDKYYDDTETSNQINLNTVRIIQDDNEKTEDTTSKASKVFSFNMNLE